MSQVCRPRRHFKADRHILTSRGFEPKAPCIMWSVPLTRPREKAHTEGTPATHQCRAMQCDRKAQIGPQGSCRGSPLETPSACLAGIAPPAAALQAHGQRSWLLPWPHAWPVSSNWQLAARWQTAPAAGTNGCSQVSFWRPKGSACCPAEQLRMLLQRQWQVQMRAPRYCQAPL